MTSEKKVLIVEDEQDMAFTYEQIIRGSGMKCLVSTEPREVVRLVSWEKPDIILCDLRMPEVDGMELLERIKAEWPGLPVIIITGYASIDVAVEAMRKGASDFLAKPFPPDELLLKVQRVFDYSKLEEENLYLRRDLNRERQYERIVGESRAIRDLFLQIDRISATDCRVLITGETGTGKELVAREIHRRSLRKDKGFYAVNCVSFTGTLLESELFGHEKGAFTSAHAAQRGLFEIADKGTIFFDEIGETSPSFQANLLRVIQEGEFKRLGGERILRTDVRVLSSTNRDIKGAIAAGTFRGDLFYRLSVVQIHLPPLRDRKEDIPLLVEHFLEKCFAKNKKRVGGITSDTLDLLLRYPWPGNIRELENAVERATLMASGDQLTAEDFAFLFTPESDPRKRKGTLEDLEKELIERTLVESNWNKTLTARRMGISRRALYEKALRLGISLSPLGQPSRA
ncbi:MAG: sigma-54-dependent Fis family transcriptional regulator [Deltaproteobacteria bacterium]|nr:sigma-54-dependent Fis family transcriptional regulator [Deltaproteobacteria bacterium]